MRATIHIECTPAEARAFFGLPDLQPIQAAVIGQMQKRMLSEIDRFSPEALLVQWLSAFPQNVERMSLIVRVRDFIAKSIRFFQVCAFRRFSFTRASLMDV